MPLEVNGTRIGIIHPGPPVTCGGVMAAELAQRLRGKADVEQVFVERRRKCRSIQWREPPDRIVGHWTRYLAFWQINARLPRYDLYHYLSERHARLLKYDRKPAVATIHDAVPLRADGVYSEGTKRRFTRNVKMLLDAQAIVTNTYCSKKDLIDLFGIPEERIDVVYPGVNHAVHSPRDKKEARRLLGLPASVPVLLNIGNENKNNNIPALVEVLAIVQREYPDAILLRIGPTSPRVDEALESLGLRGKVVRPGPDEGATTLYNYHFNAADLYVCLDHYTGYSIQNLSAMASGCPVVSSRRGGFGEIAGDSAVLIDHADLDSVAGAIVELLGDDTKRNSVAARGLQRSREFSWDKTAGSYLEIYGRILGGS
jgi:glycosyltransferase involved in cell wall biosynthesis